MAARLVVVALVLAGGAVAAYSLVAIELQARDLGARTVRPEAQAVYVAEAARLERQRWTILGAAGLWFAFGLVLLAPVHRPQEQADLTVQPPAQPEAEAAPVSAAATAQVSALDLTAAARLCTALSRMTKSADLQPLFAQAADVLDASGIILWMGAGDELFAVTAHGYSPDVLTRLGPIPRGADNATASAWRTGHMTSVAADRDSNGAIVAPMFGASSCIGALAIEVRHGRELDAATRAVASMIAAQLAAVAPTWPAASTPDVRSATA